MKKVLSVVLAVAMVLGCVASLAFVIGTQIGNTTRTDSALRVDDFHVTDEIAMTTGIKVYSDLADLDGNLYAKNQIIRFALDLAVYNPNYLANGVEHASNETAALIIESDTVDFTLNQQQPYASMVLYKPYYVNGIVSTNLVNAVPNTEKLGSTEAKYVPTVAKDGTMTINVNYSTYYASSETPMTAQNVSDHSDFVKSGLRLYGQSNSAFVEKTSYTLVFTGVTKGDTTQEGLVTVKRVDTAGDTFDGDGVVYVTKNGRTYRIRKFYDSEDAAFATEYNDGYKVGGAPIYVDMKWDSRMVSDKVYNGLYEVVPVAYQVALQYNDGGTPNDYTDGTWGYVGMFETEQVRYGDLYGDLAGDDVENVGVSLGLDYYDSKWHPVVENTLVAYGQTVYYKDTVSAVNEIYKTGSNPDYLYTDNGTALSAYGVTARQALNNFMSDFGFGTGSEYSFKIQDVNFTNEGTYEQLGEATYNGNAIVIEQPEEDPDVEEPTDNDEVPDEGDIDEEPIPDEGDIDEEPVPDEPVPETGDASAAVAVALTAAALVAAAGLAVVLKKAR